MINPKAIPQSATVQDFQDFGNNLNSADYNDTLNAMRYMQSQRQPTQGIMGLPQVTVPMQEGGGMEQAMMEQQLMQQQPQVSPEEEMALQQEMGQRQEGAMQAEQQLEQMPPEARQQYEAEVAELQQAAQGLASLGREGDTELVHMTPQELQGLMSLGEITYNPITGLPEAFSLKSITKPFRRAAKSITKPIRRIAKSKVFKTIAPIALAIAAPYALGALAPSVFGAGATFAGGALGAGTALGAGVTTGIGSLLGGLASGQKFGDAAKGALLSGATAGLIQGGSNVIAGKGFQSGQFTKGVNTIGKDTPVGLMKAPTTNVNVADTAKTTFKPTGMESIGKDIPMNLQSAPTITNVASTTAKPLIQLEGAGQRFVNIAKDDLLRDNLLKTGARVGTKVLAADLATTNPDEFLPEAVEEDGTTRVATPQVYDPTKEGFKQVAFTTGGDYGNFGKGLTEEDLIKFATQGGMRNILGRTRFRQAAEGGLVQLAKGGEFSGMVPGEGGGMDDNVYMPIKEGTEQVGTLAVSPTEYVVDSYTMAALGDGNPDEGAKVMDRTIKQIRKKAYGTTEQPNEIDGLAALRPMAQGV
jgi:hypothetical protein